MNGRRVFWDGRVRPVEEARVSVLDAGFLYGDGIYETMRAYRGTAFARERHLDRLQRSAEAIHLELPPRDRIRHAIDETLRANGLRDAVLRVTVTRGRLEKRLDLSTAPEPSLLVTCEPLAVEDDAIRGAGVRVVYSRYVRPSSAPLAGVKSTNYQVSLFARNEAREAGAREVLVPDETGHIVEGAAANIFLIEKGILFTPPLTAGILGGITREIVLELAGAAGVPIREETLSRERINAADELFLSGTTIQVTPVTTVGDRPVGTGRPGPVTLRLLAAYHDAVRADIARSAPTTPSDSNR